MKTLLLTMLLVSVVSKADLIEKIPVDHFDFSESGFLHWDKIPVIQGRATISPISPDKPVTECSKVFAVNAKVNGLWKKIEENQKKANGWIQWLNAKCPRRRAEAMYWVRYIFQQMQEQIKEVDALYPAEFQIPDRNRKIEWSLSGSTFFPSSPYLLGKTVQALSGKLKIVDGGWYGKFTNLPEGPLGNPKIVIVDPNEEKAEKDLTERVLKFFKVGLLKNAPHIFEGWDWEGDAGLSGMPLVYHAPTVVLDEPSLTPAQACLPALTLTGALMMKAKVTDFGETQGRIQFGTGPVFLRYENR